MADMTYNIYWSSHTNNVGNMFQSNIFERSRKFSGLVFVGLDINNEFKRHYHGNQKQELLTVHLISWEKKHPPAFAEGACLSWKAFSFFSQTCFSTFPDTAARLTCFQLSALSGNSGEKQFHLGAVRHNADTFSARSNSSHEQGFLRASV